MKQRNPNVGSSTALGFTDSQFPPEVVLTAVLSVIGAVDVTHNSRQVGIVDPAVATMLAELGLKVSFPTPPPTVNVTSSVCVLPPLTANEICP
jgi:hypothetical protein